MRSTAPASSTSLEVRVTESAVSGPRFEALLDAFAPSRFEALAGQDFPFYRTTFWFALDRAPANIFETIACELREHARPSRDVSGVEWWFSVLSTNATPHWLLPCHFDRSDLKEKDHRKIRHPDTASVLFLNRVPYGDLVVTDQVLTAKGRRPRQPTRMHFVEPSENQYAAFPGNLYHGVIGRMWRPLEASRLRITMAINWWRERPQAEYLRDSRDAPGTFGLDA